MEMCVHEIPVKLGKMATETSRILKTAFGEEIYSCTKHMNCTVNLEMVKFHQR